MVTDTIADDPRYGLSGEILPGTGPLALPQKEGKKTSEDSYPYSVSSEASLLHPERNQDYCLADPDNGLFIVADGMGNTGDPEKRDPGSVAASASLEIMKCYQNDLPQTYEEFEQRAKEAWNLAKSIQEEMAERGDTTLTLVQVVNGEAWFAWNGDSPAGKIIREKGLFSSKTTVDILITPDNIASGRFDPEKDDDVISFINKIFSDVETDEEFTMADQKLQHMLSKKDPQHLELIKQRIALADKYLGDLDLYFFWYNRHGTFGLADTISPHTKRVSLEPEALLFLASDGINDPLSLRKMAKIASDSPMVENLAPQLVSAAQDLYREQIKIDAARKQAEKEGREYGGPYIPLRLKSKRPDDATAFVIGQKKRGG